MSFSFLITNKRGKCKRSILQATDSDQAVCLAARDTSTVHRRRCRSRWNQATRTGLNNWAAEILLLDPSIPSLSTPNSFSTHWYCTIQVHSDRLIAQPQGNFSHGSNPFRLSQLIRSSPHAHIFHMPIHEQQSHPCMSCRKPVETQLDISVCVHWSTNLKKKNSPPSEKRHKGNPNPWMLSKKERQIQIQISHVPG